MTNQRQIVVISEQADAHLPFVQRHLDQSMLVIDPAAVLAGTELSFDYSDSVLQVRYDGHRILPAAVWYRKPDGYAAERIPVQPDFQDYAASSLSGHFSLLRTAFPEALWVSDYYAIAQAENKTLQFRLAAAAGFTVPDTLFTSDSAAAERFIANQPAAVVKSLATTSPAGMMFPTTRITKDKPVSLQGLQYAPAVFQTAIEPMVELRVTVIGQQVFVAAITAPDTPSHPQLRDWRYAQNTNRQTFVPYDGLPLEMQQACQRLTQQLGLQYGAIDLIIDRSGTVWFLEINPNGQWAFIEEETGLPLGKAMADLLSGVGV